MTFGDEMRRCRRERALSLRALSKRVAYTFGYLGQIERGERRPPHHLALALDAFFETGNFFRHLAVRSGAVEIVGDAIVSQDSDEFADLLVVRSPDEGATISISRRRLLIGLSLGALSGEIVSQVDHFLESCYFGNEASGELLERFDRTFAELSEKARSVSHARLIDDMVGHVALLDRLCRRGSISQRRDYAIMQARYAESLSWLCEEAGDVGAALYWVDRAAQWAAVANWTPMVAYTFVRRSMLVVNFADDGLRAVDAVAPVLSMSELSWVRGLAYKQTAMGYALAGQADASSRALEKAVQLLDRPGRDDEALLGQRSVVGDDLYAVYRTTCDIYLGEGSAVVEGLEPRLNELARSSLRTATISRAKLARAYANSGQPADAIRHVRETVNVNRRVVSCSAMSEIRRTMRVLRRWESRVDVRTDIADLVYRLSL